METDTNAILRRFKALEDAVIELGTMIGEMRSQLATVRGKLAVDTRIKSKKTEYEKFTEDLNRMMGIEIPKEYADKLEEHFKPDLPFVAPVVPAVPSPSDPASNIILPSSENTLA